MASDSKPSQTAASLESGESSPESGIVPCVIGTAGHIDHGKSTLVRALTGIDPDRLQEEKDRGLTIDLGFAPLQMPDGRTVGIIDVPGHERFIKNMVAGATGIDLVLLVVAADDGVMPQTREHLDIMGLLGLKRGLVALTKVDAVDSDLVELARLDVGELLEGTFLEGAPILPVSAITGQGMDELRAVLFAETLRAETRSAEGIFRMPVQRVFSVRGFGTVLTGIPVSGTVKTGDILEVQPAGIRGKVRGLQAYGQTTDSARAGHSTAINITDVNREQVERGAVAASPGFFQPASMLGARFTALPSLGRPVQDRTAVRVHLGTAEVLGELCLLDTREVLPGSTALAQLRLRDPAVCAPGDPFVVRAASPLVTLGGGTIIEESRWRLKRFKDFVLDELSEQESGLSDPRQLVDALLMRSGGQELSAAELAVRSKLPSAQVTGLLEQLESDGEVRPFGREHWMHTKALEQALDKLTGCITAWFEENSQREFLEALELRRQTSWERAYLQNLLEILAERQELELVSGGRVRLMGRTSGLQGEALQQWEALQAACRDARFQIPSLAQLSTSLGQPEPELRGLCDGAVDRGEMHRIQPGMYLLDELFQFLQSAVRENCEANGTLAIPSLRDLLGTSRKFLIPLLEHLDHTGLTIRQGANRVLRAR